MKKKFQITVDVYENQNAKNIRHANHEGSLGLTQRVIRIAYLNASHVQIR